MKLILNLAKDSHLEILDRVKTLTLAHELVEYDGETPTLLEGATKLDTEKDISAHLDSLSGELHNWYYCDC